MMSETSAFINDPCSWKIRISFPPLKILFENKSFLLVLLLQLAFTFSCCITVQQYNTICNTSYPFLMYFLNQKLLDKRAQNNHSSPIIRELAELVFSASWFQSLQIACTSFKSSPPTSSVQEHSFQSMDFGLELLGLIFPFQGESQHTLPSWSNF